MSRIQIIPPSQDLIRTVAGLMIPIDDDYSRQLVVFPGRRPAHFLRKIIAENHGRPFIPPVILSIEDLVGSIAGLDQSGAAPVIDTLDAVAMLFSLHKAQQTRLGGDHFLDVDRFYPLGEKLFTELEEMKMAMLDPAAVAEKTGTVAYANGYVIAELYESFYRMVEREGRMTRAMAFAHAATSFTPADIAAYDRVVLAGLYALTPSEQVLLKEFHACDTVHVVFIAGPGLGRHLRSLGLTEADQVHDPEPPAFTFVRAPDLHGQIGALSTHLTEQGLDDVRNERHVLVLPRPDALFPVVNHLLPLFPDDGYNVSMGYPLTRTPLSGLFRSLAEATERTNGGRWFVPDYLRVMLHPYIKSVRFGDRTEVTRILIHTIEEWLGESAGRGMRTLEEIEQSDEIFTRAVLRLDDGEITSDDLRQHTRDLHRILLRGWDDRATLGEFAESCRNIVRFVHDRTSATRHPYFSAFSDTMMDGLHQLSRSALGSLRMGSAQGSFALLAHLMASRNVPFPGSPLHGFQVLGLLETRGLSFDHVYILEANDDILPGSSPSDHLLPEQVRRSLGMETRQEREEIIEYYLSVLFAGAKSVWVSWNDAEGTEKSRFVERLVWEQEQKEGRLLDQLAIPVVRYGLQLEPRVPVPVRKTHQEAAAISRRSLSAGALDTYLRCQLKFYYGYVLGLSSPDDVTGEVEHADIGNLVHDVLHEYLKPWKGRTLEPEQLDPDAVQQMAEALFDKRFGVPTSASTLLMRERISTQAGRFIDGYQRPLAERVTVCIDALEETMEGSIGQSRFRVRTDRVERRTEAGRERVHILDYKTGGKDARYAIDHAAIDEEDRDTWGESIGSFQLFLYSMLFAGSRGLDPAEMTASYLFLGKQSIDQSIEIGLFDADEEERRDKMERLERIVLKLTAEMRDADVPFSPAVRLENECPQCPFRTICGTSWTERRGGW